MRRLRATIQKQASDMHSLSELRQKLVRVPTPSSAQDSEATAPQSGRSLSLLIEGIALSMPEIDEEKCQQFRSTVNTMAIKVSDRSPDADKLAIVQTVLQEFSNYRDKIEVSVRERQKAWRTLTATLLCELLGRLRIDPRLGEAASLVQGIRSLVTGEEIQAFSTQLSDFLRLSSSNCPMEESSPVNIESRFGANDNALGLLDSSAAIEHLRKVIDQHAKGFVVLFHLSCLDVVGERFGWDAVQDSVMAVSAFLSHHLGSDDAIYHWSVSTLLAIVQSPAPEPVLTASVQRIVNNNRDIFIQLGDRSVMLRIPLTFKLTPIAHFNTADDLYRLG
jgi:hypothetical protein